jgi:predicted transcriptional regulator
MMRTTIDIPDDLLRRLKAMARDRNQSLSKTIAQTVEAGFHKPSQPGTIEINPATGLPLVYLGRPSTTEDVRSLDDDE